MPTVLTSYVRAVPFSSNSGAFASNLAASNSVVLQPTSNAAFWGSNVAASNSVVLQSTSDAAFWGSNVAASNLEVLQLTSNAAFWGSNAIRGLASGGVAWSNIGGGSNLCFSLTSNLADGAVAVGKSNPQYKLDVNGDIYASGDVLAFSDARYKRDIRPIYAALDKVMQLQGCTYAKTGDASGREYVGLLAQQVEQVLPQAVSRDNDGFLSVAYGNMTALLVEAIKDLSAQVSQLQGQLRQ
jgi:Chaperone of endosialidase